MIRICPPLAAIVAGDLVCCFGLRLTAGVTVSADRIAAVDFFFALTTFFFSDLSEPFLHRHHHYHRDYKHHQKLSTYHHNSSKLFTRFEVISNSTNDDKHEL